VTRNLGTDADQTDLFGAVPVPKAPKARAARLPRTGSAGQAPAAPDGPASVEEGITGMAARLSPADLDELAAALSDEALARLVLAAVRQLRRRLARGGTRAGRRSSPALERAARQLAAELGGEGSSEDM